MLRDSSSERAASKRAWRVASLRLSRRSGSGRGPGFAWRTWARSLSISVLTLLFILDIIAIFRQTCQVWAWRAAQSVCRRWSVSWWVDGPRRTARYWEALSRPWIREGDCRTRIREEVAVGSGRTIKVVPLDTPKATAGSLPFTFSELRARNVGQFLACELL